MVDLWEMCVVDIREELLRIFRPNGGRSAMEFEEFIKFYHPSDKAKELLTDIWGVPLVIGLLLDEGWEPYSGDRSMHIFRRKYQGSGSIKLVLQQK